MKWTSFDKVLSVPQICLWLFNLKVTWSLYSYSMMHVSIRLDGKVPHMTWMETPTDMTYGKWEYLKSFLKKSPLPVGAHGSIVIGVMQVTQTSLLQAPLWSLNVVCCARRQGTLSTLSEFTQLKLNIGIWRQSTCNRLMSNSGESVTFIHLAQRKLGTSTCLMHPFGSEKI